MKELLENRTDKRKFCTVTFDYTFSRVNDESGLESSNAKGVSSNISKGGLGFFTSMGLEAGQPITIYHNRIFDHPVSAEVRWCVKQSDSLFKIGVCFN